MLPESKVLNVNNDRKMITVTFHPGRDNPRARLLLRRIHGALTAGLGQGSDIYRIRIVEKNKSVLLAWPDDPIGLMIEDMEKLEDLVGKENINIKPIHN